ncbi:MmgE/PrpD family protein [Pseudooctadecabacter sp.]|uniref:MmgE/PrpD family protein n=1 Tax=Pseudooctadecabacter sp. TaxID=1966338 RepID=UPI0035C7A8A6
MTHDLLTLETFLANHEGIAIPAHSLQVQELCLLDFMACGLGALRDDMVGAMARYAATLGAGGSSVFYTKDMLAHGAPARYSARDAAFINGTIGHALDFDDTHFGHIGHVSTVVIPATLAVAETTGADFDVALRAMRIGSEVALRVGLWLGRSHYQAGWHQTATAGAFGAAVAAGLLMGTHPRATLLNVAGFVAGQKAQFGSAMKPVNAGQAAAHGVQAASLAQAGLTGSPDVVAALLATHAGAGDTDAFADLGQVWQFDDVTHKYHVCCHGTHAMIEALLSLQLPRGTGVDRIEVRTHPRWMTVCNKPDCNTWQEGKFSYAFLAALILNGESTIGAGPELNFPKSQATSDMMARVHVTADADIAEVASHVRVTLTSGEVLEARHDLSMDEPLTKRRARLIAKGEALLVNGVTTEITDAIDARDLGAVLRVMRRVD